MSRILYQFREHWQVAVLARYICTGPVQQRQNRRCHRRRHQNRLDYNITENLLLNASIAKLFGESESSVKFRDPSFGSVTISTRENINPWIFTIGIGYKLF